MKDKQTILHDASGNGVIVDNGNGMPWWFKAGYLFGIPAAIAAFLVWFVTLGPGGDRSEILAVSAATEQIYQQINKHMDHTETLHRNIEDYMRVQNLLTRQLCVNAATTADERAACFRP